MEKGGRRARNRGEDGMRCTCVVLHVVLAGVPYLRRVGASYWNNSSNLYAYLAWWSLKAILQKANFFLTLYQPFLLYETFMARKPPSQLPLFTHQNFNLEKFE